MTFQCWLCTESFWHWTFKHRLTFELPSPDAVCMYVTGQLIHIIIIVDWFHNKLLKKKVGVHCSASALTISGKSSAVTSVTAEAVSLCGLVPSASVSAHSRLSFSNVGKKYLQRQNNTMNSVMRNVTNFVGKDFSLPNTTISHWPVGWRLTYFNFLAASLHWPRLVRTVGDPALHDLSPDQNTS